MHLSGEANLQQGSQSESNKPAGNEGRGANPPGVTGIQPETTRSNPEEGEVRVKPCGGLKRFYGQVFFSLGIRGEKPIESGDSWFLSK